jgi:transcriptional regulator GlxA family with amidase domain
MGEFERLDSFAPNPFRTIALRKASLELLDVLLRASKVKDAAKVLLRYGRLRPVVEELNGNYAADLDVGALAKKACLSRPQFHRQFKALVGLPPLEYAKRLRLKEAERLLRSSDLGMREIGERVGWPNQFHFSRIFKGFYGVPPLRYRQASQSRGEVLA